MNNLLVFGLISFLIGLLFVSPQFVDEICTFDNNIYFPLCPQDARTIAINATVYIDEDGGSHLPSTILEVSSGFVNDESADVVCFGMNNKPDYDCTVEVRSGAPASEANAAVCKLYKCSKTSNCNCKLGYFSSYYKIISDGFQYKSVKTVNVQARMILKTISPQQRRLLSVTDDEVVFLEYKEPIIRLSFTSKGTHQVHFRKESFQDLVITDNGTMTYIVPDALYTHSGLLVLTIYRDAKLVSVQSVDIIGATMCRLRDCIICSDAIQNLGCLSAYQQFMLFLVVSSFGILILYCCRSPILYLLKIALFLILFVGATLIGCFIPRFMPARVRDIQAAAANKLPSLNSISPYSTVPTEEAPDEAELSLGAEEVLERKIPTKEGRPKPAKKTPYLGKQVARASTISQIVVNTLLFVLLFSPLVFAVPTKHDLFFNKLIRSSLGEVPSGLLPAQSCVTGITIPATSTTCFALNSTHQNCTTVLNTLASIPFVGGSACYTFVDGNHHILFDLIFHYGYVVANWTLGTSYYTANYTVATATKFVCENPLSSSGCALSCNNCASGDPGCGRTAYGQLTGPAVQYSGDTTCKMIDAHVLDQCSWLFPNCLFNGYSIVPDTNYLEVKPIGDLYYYPAIIAYYTDHTQPLLVRYLDTRESYKFMDNITVRTSGILQAKVPRVEGYSFVRTYYGDEYLSYASKPNHPIKGELGEIQADTVTELYEAGSHLSYAPSLVDRLYSGPTVKFTNAQTAALKFNTDPTRIKLPSLVEGDEFYADDTHLTAIIYDAPEVLLDIKTVGALTVTRKIALVCPVAVIWAVNGYYASRKGSTIFLNATSSCADGGVTFKIVDANQNIDLWTHSSQVKTTLSHPAINFNPSSSVVKFTLRVIGSGGTIDIPVEYTALKDTQVTPTQPGNSTDGIPLPDDPNSASCAGWFGWINCYIDSFAKYLDDFILGHTNWWMTILMGAVIVAVVIAALVLTIGAAIATFQVLGLIGPITTAMTAVTNLFKVKTN